MAGPLNVRAVVIGPDCAMQLAIREGAVAAGGQVQPAAPVPTARDEGGIRPSVASWAAAADGIPGTR